MIPRPLAFGRLAALFILGCSAAVSAATFTVTNTASSGAGSLNQAITSANASSGANAIHFAISGSGVQTISGSLPAITSTVTVDGSTQPGYSSAPLINIPAGLTIDGSYCKLIGLSLGSNNGSFALTLSGGGGTNSVSGCYLGVGPYGTNFLNLSGAGVQISESSSNILGGTNAAARNIISGGSNVAAVYIADNSAYNVIEGNWIGLDATGKKLLPGASVYGIDIESCASNLIGAALSGAGNVIVGASEDGILIDSSESSANSIQGNFIGTDPTGTIALANQNGILINYGANSNLIGGASPLARNIISGNTYSGVDLWGYFFPPGPGANTVQGNYIGTDISGKNALGNGGIGIFVSYSISNLLGGDTPGLGNLISGNGGVGIDIGGDTNDIEGNIIGLDVTGQNALGNQGNGITLQGIGNQIGGDTPGAGNIVSANAVYGIYEYGGSSNVIEGNFIGLDVTGQNALGNTYDGISIDDGSWITIGGTNAGAGNVIAGNGTEGICLGRYAMDTNIIIIDNFVGVTAPNTSGITSVGARAIPRAQPRGNPSQYVVVCKTFDTTYGTYPLQINSLNTACPPAPYSWISENVFGSCYNSCCDIPNGGSCWFVDNTMICPSTSPPVVTSGATVPPTLLYDSQFDVTIAIKGADNAVMNTTLYGITDVDTLQQFTPLQNQNITTDSSGNGTQSINPTQAPFTGQTQFSCGYTDPCGGISELCTPVSVSSGGGTTPPPPGTTAANFLWGGNTGCPVSTFTGEMYETVPPDLKLGGPLPLRFQRYYGAFIGRDGYITGRLGDNWVHNFEMNLITTSSNVIDVVTQFGRVIQFSVNGTNFTLMGRTDVPYHLASSGANYILGDPFTQRLYTFNSSGNLIQIADGRGNSHTLTYSSGLLASVSDGLGHSFTFQYNSSGQLTNVSDGSRSVGFVQTGAELTKAIDPLAYVNSYSYISTNGVAALLTVHTQPNGNVPYSQTYDASARVATQIEAGVQPGANVFTYNSATTDIADPTTAAWQDSYTPLGELTNTTDPAGHSILMSYNTNGQRISVTDRLGHITTFGYHAPSGKMSAYTNSDGTIVTIDFSSHTADGIAFYDLASINYPDGTSESATYDSQGNMLTSADRSGQIGHYTYNSRGQVLTAQNSVGGVTTCTYNSDSTMATRRDSDTGTTTFQYDQFRRLTNVINPDLTSSSRTYDADDRLTSVTDENGHIERFTYDGNGNVIQLTDANGNHASFGYDARNRCLVVTNRVGSVTHFSYDARGMLTTNISPTGDVTSFTYDSRRRPSVATDPVGHPWQTGYDNEAMIISGTNPSSQTSSFARNSMGQITNVADALDHQTALHRDELQRITEMLDPLSRSNNYAYEAHDDLAATARQGLGYATYDYNLIGMLSRVTDLNGQNWTFTYTTMGRAQSVIDPLERTRGFTYDSRGRISVISYPDGTTRTNTYDAVGNPIAVQYSAGPDLQYTYDALNRPATAGADMAFSFDAEGRLTNTASSGENFGATYDASGRITSVSYFDGAFHVNYSYDRRGLLTNVTDSLTSGHVGLTYDASDRLTSMTRGNGVNGSYSYDAAGRLTNLLEGSLIDYQYTLDAANEITRQTISAPLDPATLQNPSLQSLSYDAADELNTPGYSYDARGRLIASPGHKFTWNGASRLTAIDGVTMTYNNFNQILTRAQSGATTRYFYNRALGFSPIMAERNDTTSQIQRCYVWSPSGRLLYMIDATKGNAVSYYLFDQVGSTVALTSSAGAVSDSYAYSPYGVLLAHNGSSVQPFTYNGEFGVRSESAAGLYDMRARYYDPQSARFLTPDSLWPRLNQPDALNPYEYALRNPLKYIDPLGACEYSGSDVVSSAGAALDAIGGGYLNAANVAETASDLANGEAARISENTANELFDWYEGMCNGTIAEEGANGELVYTTYTSEEAVNMVDMMFGGTPGNPFGPNAGKVEIFTPQAELQAKKWWYSNAGQEVETLENEATELSTKASKFKAVGTGLAVVGIGVQTGVAIYQDYKNGAGVVTTANDAVGTVGANGLILAAPPLAVADLCTGGAVSGGIHNALISPATYGQIAFSRVSTRDADAMKATYTRFAVGRWAWTAGEFYANLIFGE